ncbi:MAG: F0F1 ATP synthase subunit epsilon [Mariprofundaceae bacterium]|nr:F0F1 ATP synthase subunit epsilon [Mariprofundaceae bacterium]
MASMNVLVATVEREVYRGEADFLVAPGASGDLGIMPKHSPLLAMLKSGELRIQLGEKTDEVFVSGGYMEVQPDMITILADTAERAADVDEAAATEATRHAAAYLESRNGETDLAMAEAELAIATARLDWLRKKKNR